MQGESCVGATCYATVSTKSQFCPVGLSRVSVRFLFLLHFVRLRGFAPEGSQSNLANSGFPKTCSVFPRTCSCSTAWRPEGAGGRWADNTPHMFVIGLGKIRNFAKTTKIMGIQCFVLQQPLAFGRKRGVFDHPASSGRLVIENLHRSGKNYMFWGNLEFPYLFRDPSGGNPRNKKRAKTEPPRKGPATISKANTNGDFVETAVASWPATMLGLEEGQCNRHCLTPSFLLQSKDARLCGKDTEGDQTTLDLNDMGSCAAARKAM